MSSINKNLHILNFELPFATRDDSYVSNTLSQQPRYIHIRLQQRTGRQSLTTIQGLSDEINHKKLLHVFKKTFCCNGTIVCDPILGEIIQLQGDQRMHAVDFLVNEKISKRSDIKIHGF